MNTPSASTIIRLYRSLLRLSKKFDKYPNAKAFFYRNSVENVSLDSSSCPEALSYFAILNKILPSKHLYHPGEEKLYLFDLVREHFRSSTSNELNLNQKINVGFACYRKFSSIWKCFVTNVSPDKFSSVQMDRNIQAPIGLPTVSPTQEIKPGTILLSHPMIQGPLSRTAILILEHGELSGSYGIVINKPTDYQLETAVLNLPEDILHKFGSYPVRFGGSIRRIQFLHSMSGVGGFLIPLCSKPIYAGGSIQRVMNCLEKNPTLSESFKFFVGCCTWESGLLEEEKNLGYWIPIISQPDVVMNLAHQVINPVDPTFDIEKSSYEMYNKTTSTSAVSSITSKVNVLKTKESTNKIKKQKIAIRNHSAYNGIPVIKRTVTAEYLKSIANHQSSHPDISTKDKMGSTVAAPMDYIYQIDIWTLLLESLGEQFKCLSSVPHWVNTSNVESIDWR